MSDSTVHLSLPGLFSACTRPDALPDDAAPLWCRVLGVAEQSQTPLFDRSLDVAGLSYLADFGTLPARPCWRCDPVYLQSDLSRVYLSDDVRHRIGADDAGQLVELFNTQFAEDGLELVYAQPARWYLFGLAEPAEPPASLRTLTGRDMQPFMPRDARIARLLTEVQMLFHAAAVNSRREAAGRPPVNGVWIHGRGRLPDRSAASWSAVYSNTAPDRGLAQYIGASCTALPDDAHGVNLPTQGTTLIRNEALIDAGASWLDTLHGIESRWLRPLWRDLQQGVFSRLIIDDGEQACFYVDRRRARSLWRRFLARRRPLRDWVREARG